MLINEVYITNDKLMNTLIGITGRSCSGKSTLAQKLHSRMSDSVHFDIDDYIVNASYFDYDKPSYLESEAIDVLSEGLKKLKSNQSVELPVFDFQRKSRNQSVLQLNPAKFIIMEGTISFWSEQIRNLMDLKIFVDVPNDICLQRRIDRSIKYYLKDKTEKNIEKTKLQIKKKWEGIERDWDSHLEPLKVHADLVFSHPKDGTGEVLAYLNKNYLLKS